MINHTSFCGTLPLSSNAFLCLRRASSQNEQPPVDDLSLLIIKAGSGVKLAG